MPEQKKLLVGDTVTREFNQYASKYTELLRDPLRGRFAESSDFFHRRKWALLQDFFGRRGISTARLSWLDVGCGRGELLTLAGAKFARAAGCDPSKEMMAGCGPLKIVHQILPTELPFADESFDFITAVCVYHHVQREQRASLTRSIQRVLRPGGFFCMIEHNPWNPITRLIVKRCPVDVDAQLFTAHSARDLAGSAHLRILETSYFLYLPEAAFGRFGKIERLFAKLPLGGQFAVFGQKPWVPA
jgi:SAM-dependent methyltransferase